MVCLLTVSPASLMCLMACFMLYTTPCAGCTSLQLAFPLVPGEPVSPLWVAWSPVGLAAGQDAPTVSVYSALVGSSTFEGEFPVQLERGGRAALSVVPCQRLFSPARFTDTLCFVSPPPSWILAAPLIG